MEKCNTCTNSVLFTSDSATENFSGLCLLYAMELSPHLNSRPIGLVETDFGGTAIESWSSPDALAECPDYNYDYG